MRGSAGFSPREQSPQIISGFSRGPSRETATDRGRLRLSTALTGVYLDIARPAAERPVNPRF